MVGRDNAEVIIHRLGQTLADSIRGRDMTLNELVNTLRNTEVNNALRTNLSRYTCTAD